jgi:hypothetical protein
VEQYCFPYLALNDLWLFPRRKPALKRRKFQDVEDIQESCDNGAESYSTAGGEKVSDSGSIIGLRT